MFKFPFTNYQELNLDWIIKQVKNLLEVTKHDVEVVEQYENRLVLAEQAAQTAEENSNNAITRAEAATSNAERALTQTVINTNDITSLSTDATIINNKIGDLSQLQTEHKNNLVSAINDAAATGGGGGGGAVASVNGKTGVVVLDASDVGALPDSTEIPTKTSDLTNDSGFVNARGAAAASPVQSVNGQTGDVIISGSGAVDSVNGKTGVVVLDASDVGALPDSTEIPTKTSDLTNDSGFVNASGAAAAAPVQSVNGQTGNVVISGSLPTVTTADSGKLLQVVNGVWSAATIPNANGVDF